MATGTIERKIADIRQTAGVLRRSKFAGDATFLLICTVVSKAALFFGTAYAAKCLGPFNMGLSGLVLATAQQTALLYNGGFDFTAVRKIAVDKEGSHQIVQGVVTCRFLAALLVSCLWIGVCILTKSTENFGVWMLGVPVLLMTASGLIFAFQGLESLPIQNLINASGSLITAAIYFLFFSYPMRKGADLAVFASVGMATVFFSHLAYFRATSSWAFGIAGLRKIVPLIRESWRYWLLAALIFYYSLFQIPLINYLAGTREAGLYRVAYTMADGVWALFNCLTTLLIPRLAVWHNESLSKLWENQTKLLRIFVVIGLPPILVIILIADPFFKIFLGAAYSQSILLFKILVFGRFIVFLGQIYSYGLIAAKRDKDVLRIIAAGCAFSLISSSICVRIFGTISVAIISVTTEMLISALSAFFLRRAVIKHLAPGRGF